MALTTVQTGFQDDEGGSHVHLVTQDFSSAISSFEWGSSYITSTYDTYLIVWNMRDAADGNSIDLRLSSNNGSSWSTGYSSGTMTNGTHGVNHTKSYMQCGQGSGNAANEYAQGQFYLCNPMSSTFNTTIVGQSMSINTSGQRDIHAHAGMNNTNAQDNAISFSQGGFSGNLESGKYSLYGIKRS